MEEQNTTFEKVNSWVKHSIMLKLATITILMLLLLIPTSMITSVIYERESLSVEAMNEVSSKWGGSQIITGPILTIPLVYEYLDKEKNATYQTQVNWYILPEE
ncbi:MAG: inner membrane CreD family protein, partial [Fulvivirga sp.]